MAIVFNLEATADEDEGTAAHLGSSLKSNQRWPCEPALNHTAYADGDTSLANQGLFSAALACYPVVSQIAKDLDLTTLDNLARTCHLFRALLLPNRKSLISLALRCSWSSARPECVTDPGTRYSSQKVQMIPCATDLVGECRKCGTQVCRNCTAKAMPITKLAKRHRRLCNTCAKATLGLLLSPHLTTDKPAFTAQAYGRGTCQCEQFYWVCRPCGQYLVHYDQDYYRVWNWRIRYSTYLGGLGTGIGEGYEGVKCALADHCLAARKVEVEEDCSPDSSTGTPREHSSRPASQHSGSEGNDFVGYWRQEVEGIGGHLKSKVKKTVILGQTVQEFEDERETGEYLYRESKGLRRSLCSWCGRIVPGSKDRDILDRAKQELESLKLK